MVIEVELYKDKKPVKLRALIDSGAEKNCISQLAVADHNWEPERASIQLCTVDGADILSYGNHDFYTVSIDSGKAKRTHLQEFIACNMEVEGFDLILGIPWLGAADPVIQFSTRTWRHPLDRAQISVVSASRFSRHVRHQVFYCLTVKTVVENDEELPEKWHDMADIFNDSSAGVLPPHHPMEHRIDIEPDKKVPWGPLYALSENELTILRDYLDTSLDKGWIQRSISEAGAPVLFVPKKDGTLRLCVDYRGLNAVTIKNRTPLPLVGETLDRLRRAKRFTKLDLKDAYHRIRIRSGDEWKTAFRTRYGHFEYCVLPFGLSNAPATFQAYINQALIGLVDVICVVYLDDILIYSEDPATHDEAVRKVLERLRTYKLFANLKKCQFDTDTVEFLGYIISPTGVEMDPSRGHCRERMAFAQDL